jgi:hypothetical protein
MCYYHAIFLPHRSDLFRVDTRIYLNSSPPSLNDVCIAAIVGKNPGSASPAAHHAHGALAPLTLGADKMLPTVRKCFIEAFALAGKSPPAGSYVQVWNLFYLCNPSLPSAIRSISAYSAPPLCPSEASSVPIVWYGWGGSNPSLDAYKARFSGIKSSHEFYYDHKSGRVVTTGPGPSAFAKHTQGLKKDPVVRHLASLL